MPHSLNMKWIVIVAFSASVGFHFFLIGATQITFKEVKGSPQSDWVFLGSIFDDNNLLSGHERQGNPQVSPIAAKEVTVRPYQVISFDKPRSLANEVKVFSKISTKMPLGAEIKKSDKLMDEPLSIGFPLDVELYKPLRLP